jgi:small subunit ribosomal protein S20
MPVIKSAIKKLRRDKKREKANDSFRQDLDLAIHAAKKQKTAKSVSSAVSMVDKGVKKNLIHKNTAARIKSSLSKLAKPAKPVASPKKITVSAEKKGVKKPTKKTGSKTTEKKKK